MNNKQTYIYIYKLNPSYDICVKLFLWLDLGAILSDGIFWNWLGTLGQQISYDFLLPQLSRLLGFDARILQRFFEAETQTRRLNQSNVMQRLPVWKRERCISALLTRWWSIATCRLHKWPEQQQNLGCCCCCWLTSLSALPGEDKHWLRLQSSWLELSQQPKRQSRNLY